MTVQFSQQLWLEIHNIPLENSRGTEAFHCFLSVIVLSPRMLPTLVQTQQSFMEHNKVQLQLTCHPSFSNLSFGRIAVRSVHNETTTKAKKKTSNRFFICDHKGRVVSPLIMHRTSAEAASRSSSARQRQLGEYSLVLQRLTSAGPNNFRLLIWCLHETLAMEDGGPLDSLGFNL